MTLTLMRFIWQELKNSRPYVCPSLIPVKGKEKINSTKSYSFDTTKAEQIFDVLLKEKQIILLEEKKMPSINELKGQKFCIIHQMVRHSTNNCVHFRDLI